MGRRARASGGLCEERPLTVEDSMRRCSRSEEEEELLVLSRRCVRSEGEAGPCWLVRREEELRVCWGMAAGEVGSRCGLFTANRLGDARGLWRKGRRRWNQTLGRDRSAAAAVIWRGLGRVVVVTGESGSSGGGLWE